MVPYYKDSENWIIAKVAYAEAARLFGFGESYVNNNILEKLSKSPYWLMAYAIDILKSKLPEPWHTKMILCSFDEESKGYVKTYLNYILLDEK